MAPKLMGVVIMALAMATLLQVARCVAQWLDCVRGLKITDLLIRKWQRANTSLAGSKVIQQSLFPC